MREIGIGIIASLFFAVTFVLNRSMDLAGGSWMWSSSLRFIWMLPFMAMIVTYRGNHTTLFKEMKNHLPQWLLWSTIGFGLFYAPLTYAASFGPGWLVAGTWQITIVTGIIIGLIMRPKKGTLLPEGVERPPFPIGGLLISLLILIGVGFIQLQQAEALPFPTLVVSILPIVVAAFAYPLGNRKMMELCGGRLDTFQRVLGMTIASMPFWLILCIIALITVGPPPMDQIIQTFIVGVSSGVIATTLFFIATDRARYHPGTLAAVESTQSFQVGFVVVGEMLLLQAPLPNTFALIGLAIIIVGIVLYSMYSKHIQEKMRTRTDIKAS